MLAVVTFLDGWTKGVLRRLLLPSLISIAVLGVLASVVIIGGGGLRNPQGMKHTKAIADMTLLHEALGRFRAKYGSYPDAKDGLGRLVPEFSHGLPVDPWGRDYVQALTDGGPVVSTLGEDGAAGGSGSDSDLHVP